eukprot:CAMPEP_0197834388 /NCGR_PEP_ID=MMETSP1437-20131217/22110_1 /TAXON_ID=49252 ORGANISM="Eucampia antarctica, Strain CCMP1452" /NCGR_SAMPLE_ID=MMETSP1437 /ASSEMBLY_ACC=CAM_ASM_001096 /LENGTH=308 /DNA_ID=CAMNT_0043439001 /DNA_START=139 /DNA_END=1065 /DNA_ORIENTATION=+
MKYYAPSIFALAIALLSGGSSTYGFTQPLGSVSLVGHVVHSGNQVWGRSSATIASLPEFTDVSTRKNTKLHMSTPLAGFGAIAGAVSGGVLGGALHAIAGPDHLAALLPKCCGQRWYKAGRIGILWGMGHGVSATILGLTAFGLKNRISHISSVSNLLQGASSFMELAVGASLIFIGLLGIKEAREWKEEIGNVVPQSLSAAAADVGAKSSPKRAVIFNGVLHGFSWDGAPSLAPAVAVATWRGSISFLLSYALGTIAAMAITTTLIGEGTLRAGEAFNRPDIPQKLSFASSILAIGVGFVWFFLALR